MGRACLVRAVVAVVATTCFVVGPATAEVGTSPASCPGYVTHLRSARAYLAKGDRASAVVELRQAEQALDSCARGEARGSLVAAYSPSRRVS
jgi:hypothetical protein